MRLGRRLAIVNFIAVLSLGFGQQEQSDPPSRVARLRDFTGKVSLRPAGADWAPAVPNRPLTAGDSVWVEPSARATVQLGASSIRLGDNTNATISALNDNALSIGLTQGVISVRVRKLEPSERFEVATPMAAVAFLRPGDYRVDVNNDKALLVVTAREGEAEVNGEGAAYPVRAQEAGKFTGFGKLSAATQPAARQDDFDQWCGQENRREDTAMDPVTTYVDATITGVTDLGPDDGQWLTDPDEGAYWVPSRMPVGWAPYRNGSWAYVEPWGWTWIDEARWGFAPFHYGRWAMFGNSWGWVPGRRMGRPVYAPALVAFVGGGGFGASIGVSNGQFAAWVPLGPHEAYRPWYHYSQQHLLNLNRTHVTNVNVVNVTNVNYVNSRHVVAVSHENFVGARRVNSYAIAVPPGAMSRAQAQQSLNVHPTRESRMGPLTAGQRVAVPPAEVMNRRVIAKTVPVRNAGSPRIVGGPNRPDPRGPSPVPGNPKAAREEQRRREKEAQQAIKRQKDQQREELKRNEQRKKIEQKQLAQQMKQKQEQDKAERRRQQQQPKPTQRVQQRQTRPTQTQQPAAQKPSRPQQQTTQTSPQTQPARPVQRPRPTPPQQQPAQPSAQRPARQTQPPPQKQPQRQTQTKPATPAKTTPVKKTPPPPAVVKKADPPK